MPGLCTSCGQPHDDLAFVIPSKIPFDVIHVPESERGSRVWSNGELCVLDDEQFYLYGSLEIPIHAHPEPFTWGVWAKISEKDFFSYQDLLPIEGREANPPISGVLATDIPLYPTTLGLPLTGVIQPKGWRPLFQLREGAHPLVREHRDGVRAERILEISRWFDELKSGRAA